MTGSTASGAPQRPVTAAALVAGLLCAGALPAHATGAPALSGLPLNFERNVGQADAAARFFAHGRDYAIRLTATGADLSLADTAAGEGAPQTLALAVLGGRPGVEPRAEQRLPGQINYLIGNDPAQWKTGVATYGRVRYAGVYPGVDLVYYGTEGRLEYDFVVAPGRDARRIRLGFAGADTLHLTDSGALTVSAGTHTLTFERPVAYQTIDGQRRPVSVNYRVNGTALRFELGQYDHTHALVIDPVLSYLTYLGGSNVDVIGSVSPTSGTVPSQAIAIDSAKNIYVTGYTASTNFPTQAPFATGPAKTYGTNWAFVTKLAPDAKSLVYSTYFGGSNGNDNGNAIAVDAAGNAFVVGQTGSSDFPTTSGAYQRICAPDYVNSPNNPFSGCGNGNLTSAFVTKLSPSGTLLASTFLGATVSVTYASAVAIDATGRPYVVGTTYPGENIPAGIGGLNEQVGFPTTAGALEAAYSYQAGAVENGGLQTDAFVTVFDANLTTLVYSTLLGDTQNTWPLSNQGDTVGTAVTVDGQGQFYVGGWTQDAYVPTTPGSVQPAITSCGPQYPGQTVLNGRCGYVAKFTPVGGASAPKLVYASYLGHGSVAMQDNVSAIAADAAGDLYVAGWTNDAGFPTTAGSFQPNCAFNCSTGFIAKLNPTGSTLLASTFFGCVTCNGDDVYSTAGIVLDAAGNVYFGGIAGPALPVVNGFSAGGGGNSPFIAELDPALKTAKFVTLVNVNGAAQVAASGLVVDSTGAVYIAGSTNAPTANQATPGVFQPAYGGSSSDGYVAKVTPTLATTTALVAAPTSATAGTAVAFTATVSAGTGNAVPTGSVTFKDGATTLGMAALDGNGVGTYSTSALAVGSHSVTAAYAGAGADSASISGAVTVTITAPVVATTTTLSATPTTLVSGASVTLTASVTPASGSGVPTGTVTFKNGATTLGTGTVNGSGKATYTTSALPVGTDSLTASYAGDPTDNPSTSAATTVSVAPAAPAGLAATSGNASIALSWGSVTGATVYNIYQGTSAGGEAKTAVLSVTSGTTATISSLTNGTTYYYTVTAVVGGITSAASNEASATPTAPSSGGGGGGGGGGAFDGLSLVLLGVLALFGVRGRRTTA